MASPSRPAAALSLVAAAFLGPARAPAEAQQPPEQPKSPGPLAGTLIGTDSKPVPGARLYLILTRYDPDAQDRQVTIVETLTADAQGRFRFARVPPLSKQSQLAIVARQGERLGLARFAPEEEEPLSITLRPPRRARGLVKNSAGKGLPGVVIKPNLLHVQMAQDGATTSWASTELPEELQKAWATRTDTKGSYLVPALTENASANLHLELPGYNRGLAWMNAQEPAPREVTLHRRARIRGRLQLADPAMPLTGVRVAFTLPNDQGSGAKVNADGTFELAHVPPGSGRLMLVVPNTSEFQPKAEVPLTMVEGQSVEGAVLPVEATKGVRVRGRVVDEATGQGIPEFWVNVPGGSGVTTDANGEYQFYAPPGPVRVQAYPYNMAASDYLLPQEGITRTGTGTAGQTLALEEMRLRKGRSLTVRVVDPAGKPVRGATVRNEGSPEPWSDRPNRTDAQGECTLRAIRPDAPVKLTARSAAGFSKPQQVDLEKVTGPVVLVVRPELAARLTGRVLDDAGKPVAGASVQVQAMYGRWGEYPANLKTGTDGRFRSGGLPPVATYTLRVQAPRHRAVSSGKWEATSGGEHDFGILRMVRQQGYVYGTVVDARGKPVEGVRVFNSGDAEERLQTVSDAAGRFRLEGLEKGACFVFGEKAGYPLGLRRVDAPVTNARLVLQTPKLSTAPPALTAARERFAMQVVDQLLRETEGKQERAQDRQRLVELLTARDPLRATEVAEATGPAARNSLSSSLAHVALKRSVDEAIACARQVDHPWWRTQGLLDLAAAATREQAPKILAAAVASAREVPEVIYQLSFLAQCGDRMRRLGLPVGETLLRDCAARASRLGVQETEGYFRGAVAERLAEIDLDAAMGLIAPMTQKDERNRHIANIAVRYALRSPEQALQLLQGADMQTWDTQNTLARMCARLAPTQPDRAEQLLARVQDRQYRIPTLLWMAERLKDRRRAHAALARAEQELREWAARDNGDSTWDSPCLHLARAALVAKRIGYPGAADLLARALAARPPLGSRYGGPHEQQQTHAKLAVVVSLIDPALGKDLAQIVLPRLGSAKIPEYEWMEGQLKQQVLIAVANGDPDQAAGYLRTLSQSKAKVSPIDAVEFLLSEKKRQERLNNILQISSPEEDN